MQKLRQILDTVCQLLLQSTRELPSIDELRKLQDQSEGADKSFTNTDYRVKVHKFSNFIGVC